MTLLASLTRAFRPSTWAGESAHPALTKRMLRRCVSHPGAAANGWRPLAILADVHARSSNGEAIGSYFIYADPSTLRYEGNSALISVSVRRADGGFDWKTLTFKDGVTRFNLGSLIEGFSDYRITLRPGEGTQSFGVVANDAVHPSTESPDSAASLAAERIATAMIDADTVARAALRRHLAKAAHPDTVPPEQREAFDKALRQAFERIERGRFAIPS